MNKIYGTLLISNFLIETLAAASLIFSPTGILSPGLGGQWSMHYGFAVLAIASIGLWVWPVRLIPAVVTSTTGILMTFHLGILCSLVVAGDQQAGTVIHGLLASLSVFLFTQRSKIREATS